MDYNQKLQEAGIYLTKNGKQTCSACSQERKNKSDKCLSVTFSDDGVLFNCHHCGRTGKIFYRDKYSNKKVYRKPEQPKQKDAKEALYKYFEKRGISQPVVDCYQIGINSNNEIIFPYYKDGDLVNVKYRTNLGDGKKTFRQEAETEKTLFGMDLVKDTDTLIWVEGEMDVLSYAEYGIMTVSVPQGAGEKKLECIENCWDFIQKFETHIIAVDNDEAGDNLKNNLLIRLDKDKCKLVNYGRYKDANEILMDNGDLKIIIDNAQPIAPEGIEFYSENHDAIMEYLQKGDSKGFSTGWARLDAKFTIKTGNLMIVTGYPSRGKSFFVDNLLYNLTEQYEMRHFVASFENTLPRHFERFAKMKYETNPSKMSTLQQEAAISYFNDYIFTLANNRMWTIDEICEKTEKMVRKYGIKTLTIDPYNRLNNNYKDREDKYIGSILGKLCMLAKKLDILVIFVAHPKKPDGTDMPNLYSISGSADWYNMADYGLVIHRERNEQTGELYNNPIVGVLKVKDFSLGDPNGGQVQLRYDPTKYKIVESEF